MEELNPLALHMIADGERVESLAFPWLVDRAHGLGAELRWQQTFTVEPYHCRTDGLILDAEGAWAELFEVKSATSLDKEYLYDLAFQTLVIEESIPLSRLYVLHLNKEYRRQGALDPQALFKLEDVTLKMRELLPEVFVERSKALKDSFVDDPAVLDECMAPKECSCLDLCHPDLPEDSIFEVPRLLAKDKRQLLRSGIRKITDIPTTYKLNDKQRLVVESVRYQREFIHNERLAEELGALQFPLWFLDYETCISALPLFDGHFPQQQIVFQYSLQRLDEPLGKPQEVGCISSDGNDPSLPILEQLTRDLGAQGSIIVWNKTFEQTRNKELGLLHPLYAGFMENVNARIYDLMSVVEKGYYWHPKFKGSASIKNVLPVVVPELSYDELSINRGDQASVAWWQLVHGHNSAEEVESTLRGLRDYCRLDTLAMVRIYQRFYQLSGLSTE